MLSSSDFAPRRAAAFEAFHQAGARYAAVVDTLDAAEQTTRVHELWFYAAHGACDLDKVSAEQGVAEGEIELIRAALEGLGGESATVDERTSP